MVYGGKNGRRRGSGRNPASKHQIQPECRESAGWRRTGRPNPSRETKSSGANEDTEYFFPLQVTTSRIGNLTRLIHTYIHRFDHTYIRTLLRKDRSKKNFRLDPTLNSIQGIYVALYTVKHTVKLSYKGYGGISALNTSSGFLSKFCQNSSTWEGGVLGITLFYY